MPRWQIDTIVEPVTTPPSETVTMDKWYARPPDPVRDLRRQQYTYQTFCIDAAQLTQPERTQPDKWHPEIQRPRRDLERRQYTYPTFVTDPTGFTRLDWERDTERPRRDLERRQYVYPSAAPQDPAVLREPGPNVASWQPPSQPRQDLRRLQYAYPYAFVPPFVAESVTLDKWWKQAEEPRRDLRRQQYVYPCWSADTASYASLDWHPESNRPRWDLKQQRYAYPVSTQDAQALTQPETVYADKWHPESNRPPKARPPAVYAYPDHQATRFVEIVTADKWWRQASEPRRDLVRRLDLAPTLAWSTTQDFLDWYREPERPRWDLKRLQYLDPSFVIDAKQLTQPETVYPDKWHPPTERPPRPRPRLYEYPPQFRTDVVAAPETVTLDKWYARQENPVLRSERRHSLPSVFLESLPLPPVSPITISSTNVTYKRRLQYQARAFVPTVAAAFTTFGWPFDPPLAPLHPRCPAGWYVVDPSALIQPETIFPDKWHPEIGRRLSGREARQYGYPAFVSDATDFVRLGWLPAPNLPPRDRARATDFPAFTIDARQLTQSETIYVDKWWRPASEPQRDLDRLQRLYPSLAWDPQPVSAEIVTPDKWYREAARPVWDRANRHWLYPAFATDPVPRFEEILLDKWYREASTPLYPPQPVIIAQPFLFAPAEVILIAPVYPDSFVLVRAQYPPHGTVELVQPNAAAVYTSVVDIRPTYPPVYSYTLPSHFLYPLPIPTLPPAPPPAGYCRTSFVAARDYVSRVLPRWTSSTAPQTRSLVQPSWPSPVPPPDKDSDGNC